MSIGKGFSAKFASQYAPAAGRVHDPVGSHCVVFSADGDAMLPLSASEVDVGDPAGDQRDAGLTTTPGEFVLEAASVELVGS